MTKHIFWVLELVINDGQREAVEPLMRDMVAATQANEPGALNYEWFLSADAATCTIYERYADNEATLTHLTNFGNHFASRFLTVFSPARFTVYGPASDSVRAALVPFGAVHLDFLGGFVR